MTSDNSPRILAPTVDVQTYCQHSIGSYLFGGSIFFDNKLCLHILVAFPISQLISQQDACDTSSWELSMDNWQMTLTDRSFESFLGGDSDFELTLSRISY